MPIEVRNLTHCYSEGSALRTVALNDVSFRIGDGEFVGIIGHTGSGKSTLVQHLNGLLRPTSGRVLINGEDLNGEHVNHRALRRQMEQQGMKYAITNLKSGEEMFKQSFSATKRNVVILNTQRTQELRVVFLAWEC